MINKKVHDNMHTETNRKKIDKEKLKDTLFKNS